MSDLPAGVDASSAWRFLETLATSACAERKQLVAALEAVYAKHRRDDCPTDTTQQDASWLEHKGTECSCPEFEGARAALRAVGAR